MAGITFTDLNPIVTAVGVVDGNLKKTIADTAGQELTMSKMFELQVLLNSGITSIETGSSIAKTLTDCFKSVANKF